MTFRLYFDEDVGSPVWRLAQQFAVFDVLTTQDAGRANQGLSDESQLEFAASQSRTLFTFNMQDYERIAMQWARENRHHAGIVSSPQRVYADLLPGFRQLARLYPDGLPPDLCMRLPGPDQ